MRDPIGSRIPHNGSRLLLHNLLQHAKRRIGRGNPAINRLLKNDLFQVRFRESSLAQRGPSMHPEFLEASERDEGAEDEDSAGARIESWARPDLSPCVARDEI